MCKQLVAFLFLFAFTLASAQIGEKPTKPGLNRGLGNPLDTIKIDSARNRPGDSLEVFIPTIKDYTYWKEGFKSYRKIDTTLTIKKFYNRTFLQRDAFGYMPFPNIGQPLNPLEYNAIQGNQLSIIPYGKSLNFLRNEDIRYFDVKTPITEFFYENGVREGNYLSTTFSHSPNKQINYSIRYRGLRSLGRFQESLASNNAVILTTTYKNKSERFRLWMNYASQNIDNEENGGVSSLADFADNQVSGNVQSLEVNLTDVSTEFDSRRFFAGMSYGILKKINPEDSTSYNALKLSNRFTYEKQTYRFADFSSGTVTADNDSIFNNSAVFSGFDGNRRNRKISESRKNLTTAAFNWGKKLWVEAGIQYENIKVFSDSALIDGLVNIPEQFEDNLFSVVGKFDFDWNDKVKLIGNAEFTQGNFFGTTYNIAAKLNAKPIKDYEIEGGLLVQSTFPSLNLIYNQSYYKDFNYFTTTFSNQDTRKLFGKIQAKKYGTSIEASIYNIDNFTFVDSLSRPRQYNNALNLFKLRLNQHFQYKNYHLNANLQYQQVSNTTVLPLPSYFGRLTMYYQNHAFKRAAQVQLGFNLYYFAKFKSREFSPLLNEFRISQSTDQEIGAFPILDLFLNMKVKRMQLFIRGDHIFGAFGQRNYFSTPNIPYRIFKIQLGVKWYLFT